MSFLLVDIDGSQIAREHERLVVRRGARTLGEYRPNELDSVIAWGRVELTRPAMDMLLSRRIPVHLVSAGGRYRGCLLPPERTRSVVRRRQYAAFDDDPQSVRFAKVAAIAQIRNLRAVVRRWAAHRNLAAITETLCSMQGLTDALADATTLNEIRGAEGSAWRSTFEVLAAILPPELGFRARVRRPAPDPVNAILGLFGVITVNHADAVLRTVGLDPAVGYLHGDSRGGAALAMDLADIYRPMLCLAPTVTLFTKKMVSARDFVDLGYSAKLTQDGMRTAMRAYASTARRPVTRRGMHTPRGYLQHIRTDAANLVGSLGDSEKPWSPLTIR